MPRGYRPRRYLDDAEDLDGLDGPGDLDDLGDPAGEGARPVSPRAQRRPRPPRDEDDLGRRYARDDRPPPRRLAQIGEPPSPARHVPGAGAWRVPRHVPPTPVDDVEELVEGVVAASRWDRGVPRPVREPAPDPQWDLVAEADGYDEHDDAADADGYDEHGDVATEVDVEVAPGEAGPPVVVADLDEDDDEDDRRRPPSWYRRGDDDLAPRSRPRPRPRLVPPPEVPDEPDVVPEVAAAEPPRPRWEPRPLPEPEHRPSRRREAPPRKRLVAAADARVQPAVAASRRSHPTARPAAASGPGRLASRWPGSHAGALPSDFPGGNGGDVVFRRPRPRALAVTDPPKRRRGRNAKGDRNRPEPRDARPDAAVTGIGGIAGATVADAPAKDGGRRPLSLRPPERLNNIVGAVYAALADPLAADTAEAREQRAAKVREIGLIAASSALVAVLVYGIFPVRTFLNQREATDEAQERLDKIAEINEQMRREAERLRDDDEIEMRARADYGWVFPGDELYGVLPSPVAEPVPDAADPDGTTTTTTTRPEG